MLIISAVFPGVTMIKVCSLVPVGIGATTQGQKKGKSFVYTRRHI